MGESNPDLLLTLIADKVLNTLQAKTLKLFAIIVTESSRMFYLVSVNMEHVQGIGLKLAAIDKQVTLTILCM